MKTLLREDKTQKPDFTYIGIMYAAFAREMYRFDEGATKYERLNWRYAKDVQTYKQSLIRHMAQYINGQTDEDHLAAIACNTHILMDLEELGIK